MDPAALRSAFPVLETVAYLNAGTDGPVPAVSVAASRAVLERELAEGRAGGHFERRKALTVDLRARYAEALGGAPADVAVTTSTTDGICKVLGGLELGAGDEVLTSDSEHPGLLNPLAELRRGGVTVREAPFADVADAVGPRTTLVAVSHVNWATGAVAPAALAETDALVLLDGAQGVGAVPVEVETLGCDFYAGSGQKWLCGPDGTGALWVSPAARDRLRVAAPGYANVAEPGEGMDTEVWADARAFDTPAAAPSVQAAALAALELFAEAGWAEVHERAAAGAESLADMLRAAGRVVAPRGRTTLVSWASDTPEKDSERLAGEGIVVRYLPGRGLVRASVGAWTSDEDLARLMSAL